MILGVFERFDENESLATGAGLIRDGRAFAVFNTSKNTVWFDKKSIRVGYSKVVLVGKYVENREVKFTSGVAIKVPVFEGICIGP
jgi:hypothetical protein